MATVWPLGARRRSGGNARTDTTTTNLSFADGHVDFKAWRWPKRLDLNYVSRPVADALDLDDLRWLQAGLPEP